MGIFCMIKKSRNEYIVLENGEQFQFNTNRPRFS